MPVGLHATLSVGNCLVTYFNLADVLSFLFILFVMFLIGKYDCSQ